MKNNFLDVAKFFFTKSFFRLVPLLAFGLILLLFVYAYKLEASREDAGTKAPFSAAVGVAKTAANKNKSLVETQNYSARDISLMIEAIIPEVLSFNKDNLAKNMTGVQKYFTSSGYAQYQQFLQAAAIEQAITSQNMQSGVLMETPPLEISAGLFNGAYKWLFEVPVTLSFIPANTNSYRDQEASVYNRRVRIRVQFTRVQDMNDPDAVKIEIWQASALNP